MAGAYSTDLRSRVLAAVEAGASPEAVAERFAVGRSTVYRWAAAAARDEGRREARRMGGGPPPAIRGEAEAALRRMLSGSDNHLTLAECRDRLAAELGIQVHPWTVGRAGAAPDGLGLKETEPARGRAGPRRRGSRAQGVARRGGGRDRRHRP